jgi:hypothetical protein
VLSRRRHRKNPLILSASATGIIVGLLVSVATGLAVSMSTTSSAQAADSSSVTIAAKDNDITRVSDPSLAGAPAPDLKITVSQTRGLLSQAIQVSWTGGMRSSSPGSGTGGADFLQIAQCWGEDLQHPGHPDPTTCQYGGFSTLGAMRDGEVECPLGRVDGRTVRLPPVLNAVDYQYTTGSDADYSQPCERGLSPVTSIPFRAATNAGTIASVFPDPSVSGGVGPRVRFGEYSSPGTALDGTVQRSLGDPVLGGALSLPVSANLGGTTQNVVGVNLARNQFFTKYTTNEVPWAGTGADGTGAVKFEVQTAVQTPALGCGSLVTDPVSGGQVPQSCWLVVIPRGAGDSGSSQITHSGLWWDAWQHNIAFKLEFRPTAQRCAIGGSEKQLSGSPLVEGAISSWQPSLCLGASGGTFVVSTGNEAAAVTKASGTAPSPLALTVRSLKTAGKDPVQYAPVALSGLAISFAIDRNAVPNIYAGHTTPPDYIAKNTTAFTSMNLTPRLVAKLLTSSYWLSLPPGASMAHVGYVSDSDRGPNAQSLVKDPDFLSKQDSDEWYYQYLSSTSLADLLVPNGQSDEAFQLWQYAFSDQEGRDFLAGKPDEWGMKVNPYYATVDSTYSPALTLPTVTFPKADPITKANSLPEDLTQGNDSVNLLTYRPFTSDFASGAAYVLRGDGLILGTWNTVKKTYDKSVRLLVGRQQGLAVTTAEAAARYGNVTASLRNPAGKFVPPTSSSLTSAAAAMTASSGNAAVVGFDFASASAIGAADAYPMAMPVYAAVNPLQTDATLRAAYASFIRYAVQGGQIPGVNPGELPDGFAPIPTAWVDQAMVSANAIEQGISPQSLVVGTTVIASAPSGFVAPRAATSSSEDVNAPNPNPTATGDTAGPLVGKPTPADPALGPVSAAVPAGLLSGFAAAGAVPLYSRIRRRQ